MLLVVAVLTPGSGHSATVTNTNDSGAGSLRQAVLDANANAGLDTIDFNLGGAATITLSSGLSVSGDLVIEGPGSGELTIAIEAGKTARHFTAVAVDFELSGCRLIGGSPDAGNGADGGAIHFTGGQGGEVLRLDEVVFLANTAGASGEVAGCGGAVFVGGGNLIATDCIFGQNGASNCGGAICIRPNLALASPLYSIVGCSFRANSAGSRGGAIDVLEGSDPGGLMGPQLLVTFCGFEGNLVDGGGFVDNRGGGALRVEALTAAGARHLRVELVNCQVENNLALASGSPSGFDAVGGAVFLMGGDAVSGGDDDVVQAVVWNSTFAGNVAEVDGGAWFLQGTTPGGAAEDSGVRFANCTLHGNRAGVSSPASSGSFGGGVSAVVADVEIDSCTVTANRGEGTSGFGIGVVGGIDVYGGDLSLLNSVVADNAGAPGGSDNVDELRWESGGRGVFVSNGSNLVRGTTQGILLVSGDLAGVDPRLGGLGATAVVVGASGDPVVLAAQVPKPGSPLIDAGNTPQTADQVGTPRPSGVGKEIGAIEVGGGPPPPNGGGLMITEIMYDPASAEPDWEWVEIYNPGGVAVSLGGYVLDNGDSVALGGANLLSGSVAAGRAVVVYNAARISAVDFLAAWGEGVPLVAANAWHGLTNTGGRVGLWSSYASYVGDQQLHRKAVDSVAYGVLQNGFPNPGSGESIFLTDLGLDNSLATSWAVSDDVVLPPTPLNDTYQSDVKRGNTGMDFGSPYRGGPAKDWGDLPDYSVGPDTDYPTLSVHNGARHVIIGELRLGDLNDADGDGRPTVAADGDDVDSEPDEDGVLLPPLPLANGETVVFKVTVTNRTGTNAFLHGFFDWNGDGDFEDGGERTEVVVADGLDGAVIELEVPVPANARTQTDLGARFRLSTTEGLGALGPAPDGEVEDYLVRTWGVDWGDLPDLGPGTGPGDYQTLGAHGGASHVITPLLSLPNDDTPGDAEDDLDAEADGQPSAGADGDNSGGTDDEAPLGAAVVRQSIDLVAGTGEWDIFLSTAATNLTGGDATLYAFFDIDADGDFEDAGEVQTSVVASGSVEMPVGFTFTVPLRYVVLGENERYVRFRLSTDPGLGANGPAPDGDVEDHRFVWSVEVDSAVLDFGDHLPGELLFGEASPFLVSGGGGGAVHLQSPALTLGDFVADGEADGQPSADADGDDMSGADDENGVVLPQTIVLGGTASFGVTATNTTSEPAYIFGFVDWSADGRIGPGEAAAPVLVPPGSVALPVEVSFPISVETTCPCYPIKARFRIALDPGLGPNGAAGLGEVEDYVVRVEGDSDADGLSDRFELLNFADLTVAVGASDSDQDGSSDAEEEAAGTDPNDPMSTPNAVGPFARTGDLIVGDAGSQSLLRIRSNGAVSRLFDPGQVGIPGFEVDPASSHLIVAPTDVFFMALSSGGPLLAGLGSDGVVRSVADVARIEADTGLSPVSIRGLAFGSNGKIYAIEGNSGGVLRIDPVTGSSSVFTTGLAVRAVTGIDGILVGLTPLPAGEFAVIDAASDTVIRLGFDGVPSVLASSPLIADLAPDSSMTLLPGGDLLLVDRGPDQILRVTPGGGVSVFLSSAGLRGVFGGAPNIRAISGDGDGVPIVVHSDPGGGSSLYRFTTRGLPGELIVGGEHIRSVTGEVPRIDGGVAFGAAPADCETVAAPRAIVRGGTPSPGRRARFSGFALGYAADLNNHGAIVFSASTVDEVPVFGETSGYYLADHRGAISAIVEAGDPLPGGGAFGRLADSPLEMNDRGEIAFHHGRISGATGADGHYLYSEGSLEALVRVGDRRGFSGVSREVLGLGATVRLNGLGQVAYQAELGSGGRFVVAQSGATADAIAGLGSSAVRAGFALNDLGQVAVYHPGTGDLSFGAGPFTPLNRIARLRLRLATEPSLNDRGEVAYGAATRIGDFGTVVIPNDRNNQIWLYSGGEPVLTVSEAGAAPDGGHFFDTFGDPQVNNESAIAFSAQLLTHPPNLHHVDRPVVGPVSHGLYLWRDGSVVEVARTGEPTPGGGRFLEMGSFELGDAGLAFLAEIDAGGIGTGPSATGLYVFAGGELVEVAVSGERIDGRPVQSMRLIGVNDALQVAFQVRFGVAGTLSLDGGIYRSDLARALHYRPSRSGSWDTAENWTLGVLPHEGALVCIDPAVGLDVTGPAGDVTVRRLQIDASGSNPAGLRLRSSGTVRALDGTWIGDKGRISGAGILKGGVHADSGSTIAPTGDMALGDRGIEDAFDSGGTIIVGEHELSLDSATPVQLFGLTEMRGGQLSAWSDVANSGVLRGEGIVDAVVFNDGEVRASTGERLMLWGLENTGGVNVLGGEFETVLPALNAMGGEINGRDALLRFDSGLVNEGAVAFSFGTSDFFGPLENRGASRVIVSGESNATFWDDVRIGGADFRVSAGSTAVFLGDVSGPGSITGTGSVLFESVYSPGASPALVGIGGDVSFASSSELVMELGGVLAGSGYDRLEVGGAMTLEGGVLRVELIGGFVPEVGDVFDLFGFGAVEGEFRSVVLPALPAGRFWNVSRLYTTGEVVVGCVAESFGAFQSAFFTAGEIADVGRSGFGADFDGDGLGNGLEYFLGSDPRVAGVWGSPLLSVDAGGVGLRLTFVMPEWPAGDVVLEVEASDPLSPGSWGAIARMAGDGSWSGSASVAVVPLGGGKVAVVVEDGSGPAVDGRRFLRLRVSL